MLFYLTIFGLAKFLAGDHLKMKQDEIDGQVIIITYAWEHFEYLFQNYVMNGITNSLYNVYSTKKLAKEL